MGGGYFCWGGQYPITWHVLLLMAAIILSHTLKETLRRIFRHDFCRSSGFEHNERLNFKDKTFGYF